MGFPGEYREKEIDMSMYSNDRLMTNIKKYEEFKKEKRRKLIY